MDSRNILFHQFHQADAPVRLAPWRENDWLPAKAPSRQEIQRGHRAYSPQGRKPSSLFVNGDADRQYLIALLEHAVSKIGRPCASVGKFMLRYVDEHDHFPTVQTIEASLAASHGTVQRCRERILAIWQPLCRALGFRDK